MHDPTACRDSITACKAVPIGTMSRQSLRWVLMRTLKHDRLPIWSPWFVSRRLRVRVPPALIVIPRAVVQWQNAVKTLSHHFVGYFRSTQRECPDCLMEYMMCRNVGTVGSNPTVPESQATWLSGQKRQSRLSTTSLGCSYIEEKRPTAELESMGTDGAGLNPAGAPYYGML